MELGTFQSLMTTVAIIAGVVVYWRKGGSAVTSEVLSGYKMQVEQLKESVAELQKLHRENLGEIGQLKGRLQEKNERIVYLETLIQNRNPEMTEFMKYLTKVAVDSEKFMKVREAEPSVMMEIRDFMQQINNHFATHSVTAAANVKA